MSVAVQQEKLISSLLEESSKKVDPAVIKYTRVLNLQLQEMIDHALRPKGSRERPLLMRLSCEAVGGDFTNIIPAAVAVELLHFSTLVIDDILDEAPLRCNDETVQAAYGYKNAIIIGELLNSFAFLTLMDISNDDNDEHKLLKVIQIFKETQKYLYYGQYLDFSFEHNEDINISQYLDMISKTTASLIKCSLITGAILCGGNKNQIESLAKYGESLGIAFQIRDDVAEIIGDPKVIGKLLGGDIRQGKMRLPFIKALSCSKKPERRFLIKVTKNGFNDESEVRKTIKILIESGAIEYCKEIAGNFSTEAIKHLKPFPNSPAKDALITFSEIIAFLW